MKTVVAVQDLLEIDIKPDDLLDEFVRLTERDVPATLAPQATVEVRCPGCDHEESGAAFAKLGLTYRECRRCGTLFVSPRPRQDAIDEYYRSTEASRFWRDHVVPATGAARAEKVAGPRAQWVADGIAEHRPDAALGLDLGPYAQPFAVALRELAPHVRLVAAGATADLDFDGSIEGVTVSAGAGPAAVRAGQADLAVAFDVLDRCADPRALIRSLHGALRPGGLLFVVAPSLSGFDLQVMWDRSRTITPPDRINLFTLRGFRELFASGWQIREISTPGMFDAETVRRAILSDPRGDWPRALRAILIDSGPEALADFQEFLQRHRLSSFGRLMVQKEA